LSAGLLVISSRASEVEAILKKACLYLSQETPEALADLMIRQISLEPRQLHFAELDQFSIPSTALRLRAFFKEAAPAFL
jgi:hypothetical protein